MIDRQHNKTVFICDNCGDGTEEFDNFNEGMQYIKQEGWKLSNVSGVWVHYCPICREAAEI